MKIIICCSLSASEEVLMVRNELVKLGHEVEIPHGVKMFEEGKEYKTESEKLQSKIDNDLIKVYFEKIKKFDAVLVVNPEKKGTKGYIGGNTLIEMAFGFVLNKKIYLLHETPELSYKTEIQAMKPILLEGKLEKI